MPTSRPVPSIPLRRVIGGVIRRPDLWPTAVSVGRGLVPSQWWRRRPFLPVPPKAYLRFRLQTQYGDTDPDEAGLAVESDAIDYLEWCRAWRRRR